MILVINAGSSSIKFKLFEAKTLKVLRQGLIEEIKDHHQAFEDLQKEDMNSENIRAIGHRVVHGGEHFGEATLIDDRVI
ncbi:MAG: acetate kinase, partial [Campylobacterota bacterium]|nr:acetate kinase [Campylobacterota bacterium]